jgi:signal transduction histidine kinase/FixJ family two-component response regulator
LTEPRPPETSRRPRPGARRALVVEDNAGDRWFYSELLRGRGYEVISCESGEVAWETFQAEPVPLVLLDLMLPGIDGGELCRRIRDHARDSEPLILAVTGVDEPDALANILEAGADDFLRKPVAPKLFNVRMAIAERRIQDRAERQGTTAQLEAMTWELGKLFRNLPDVFFSVDVTDQRLIQISPAAESLFGRSVTELLSGKTVWQRYLLPPEGEEDPWGLMARECPEGPVVREYVIPSPGGPPRWVKASLTVDVDPGTGHMRADGFVADVTRERLARLSLGERNRELAALYRVSELTQTTESLDQVYRDILEEVGRVMDMPMVLLEQLDRAQDRLVIITALGVELPEGEPLEVPLHQTPSGSAVQTGKASIITDPRSRKDLVHPALVALQPRAWASFPLAASGAVAGTLTVIDRRPRDMDERWVRLGMTLATAIAVFMERLEAEEALRESEARHRALAIQLQQANQELESFAYSVSHDLRAPLRTMQGFAHALLQNYGDALPAEARDYASRIIASGRQSERLITDLLAYSRLSFEQLDVKPVELQAVLDQALEQVQAAIEETGAHIRRPETLPAVVGNHTALVQVLVNLLTNAMKFVQEGRKPEVRIRTEERDDMIRLWVEDNGIGIPDGQEERIFRVFERLSDGRDQPGTGIGLAIVRRGMQRIGGSCGVERFPEGGSAFWIEARLERRETRRPRTRRNRSELG